MELPSEPPSDLKLNQNIHSHNTLFNHLFKLKNGIKEITPPNLVNFISVIPKTKKHIKRKKPSFKYYPVFNPKEYLILTDSRYFYLIFVNPDTLSGFLKIIISSLQ